jgi:hypothetical protein
MVNNCERANLPAGHFNGRSEFVGWDEYRKIGAGKRRSVR